MATVSSGDVVTLDAVSHEGLMEDQGKDPREFDLAMRTTGIHALVRPGDLG